MTIPAPSNTMLVEEFSDLKSKLSTRRPQRDATSKPGTVGYDIHWLRDGEVTRWGCRYF
jgi:hypothetical protein